MRAAVSSEIKVSVAMPTYNHERFIAQAIDSVLMQETDFPVELVIGDDCSTDGTRSIVEGYAARYPTRVKVLLHPHNLGPSHSPGKNNFVAVINACTGNYVAMLEGDDYWTDPRKLQKQVEFLEANPSHSMCFHDVAMVCQDAQEAPPYPFANDERNIYTIEDLVRHNFIPTCSVVFRRGLFGKFPSWFYEVTVGDWPLHVINASFGDVGRLHEQMGVYRVHAGSVWSIQDPVRVQLPDALRLYDAINSHLGFAYDHIIAPARQQCLDGLRSRLTADAISRPTIREAEAHVWSIMRGWAHNIRISEGWKSDLLCEIYVHFLFTSYQKGDLSAARYCWLRVVRMDRSWLRNLGFCSIGLEAFLGSNIARWMRDLARGLRRLTSQRT